MRARVVTRDLTEVETRAGRYRSRFCNACVMCAAGPPDVRKGYAFPKVVAHSLGAPPRIWGVAPIESKNMAGRPQAFRTSGGGAAVPFCVPWLILGLLSWRSMSRNLDQLTADAMKLPL